MRFFFPVAGSMMLCGREVESFRSSPPGPRQFGVSIAGSRARFGGIELLATGEETLDNAEGVCGGYVSLRWGFGPPEEEDGAMLGAIGRCDGPALGEDFAAAELAMAECTPADGRGRGRSLALNGVDGWVVG